MKKGKRIPGHRHCPNLVRDAGKKPPPARGTTHYSRRALSSTALLSLLNCARACPSIVGIERLVPPFGPGGLFCCWLEARSIINSWIL